MNSSVKIIGGEFEINLSNLKRGKKNLYPGFLYSSGRAALFNVLQFIVENIKIKTIYLPDYLCSSIIDVVALFKLNVKFYPINNNLEAEIEYLFKKKLDSSVILLINYFGCIDLRGVIDNLKEYAPDICIIEDNVQSMFSMYNDSSSDFSFTSFRKQLPVPDGGWVKSKYANLPDANAENTFVSYKIAGGLLKNYKRYKCIKDEVYLTLFKNGEDRINENLNSEISDITLDIIENINIENVRKKRIANASYLASQLDEIGIFPVVKLFPSFVPLFLPIMIENRDEIRKILAENNIFCPIHWPTEYRELKMNMIMAKNELSLVIDQRYGKRDMDKIANILKKNERLYR